MKKRISDLMDHINGADFEMNQETHLSSDRIKELTMSKITNNRKLKRTGFRVLIAAAVIAALTVTVFAAGNLGWFRQYFEKQTDAPLTSEQIAFIEENEQTVENIQSHEGWSVELKTYLASTNTVYMVFHISAPAEVDIVNKGRVFLESEITGAKGSVRTSNAIYHLDDGDGRNNTEDYVCISDRIDERDTNSEWNVHISSITHTAYSEPLAVGDWNFTLDLTKATGKTIELISEPIQILGKIYLEDPLPDGPIADLDYLTVRSILLSPLDVIILYEPINNNESYFEGAIEGTGIVLNTYAIMKNGSAIQLRSGHPSFHGEAKLIAECPIVVEEVEYLFFADGTKIILP